MIIYNKFVKLMVAFKSLQEATDGVDKALKILDPDFGGFFLGRYEQLAMEMLKEMTEDHWEHISYFFIASSY